MPKKLACKYCNICGIEVLGIKRTDRKAYHYPPRCEKCAHKVFDPIKINNKKQAAIKANSLMRKPIGSTRLHKSKEGLFYIQIKIADPSVWEYQHRMLLNAPKNLQVHHINGNTLDNSIDNLVLVDPKQHRIEHGLQGRWSIKYECCKLCNKTTSKHCFDGECSACYQKLRYIPRK